MKVIFSQIVIKPTPSSLFIGIGFLSLCCSNSEEVHGTRGALGSQNRGSAWVPAPIGVELVRTLSTYLLRKS